MKASTRRIASMSALATGVAVFSTGCTLEELLSNGLLIAKIIALFV